VSKYFIQKAAAFFAAFAGCVIFLCLASIATNANPLPSGILCRPELSLERRAELAKQLREITGWADLDFDAAGAMRPGEINAQRGSATARALLGKARRGDSLLVIEDASDNREVIFSRVVGGQWSEDGKGKPRVYIIQVDFADFARVSGDREALAAFNAAWGVLHEVAHAVEDASDAPRTGEMGECEALINVMRRECGLAERAAYHFHFIPGLDRSSFKAKIVRLSFERHEPATNRKKQLWVVWDADLVGGLDAVRH
jgi:hypothetical protein